MNRDIKLIIKAAGISFMGTLPLGTLNLYVANFTSHNDMQGAIGFSLAAVLVEMFVVRIALSLTRYLEGAKRYYRYFGILAVLVIASLSVSTLQAACKMEHFHAALPYIALNPVLTGLFLSIINPLHLPFWMGWTSVFKAKKILHNDTRSYNLFVIAIGIGTLSGFTLYGIAGRYLITFLGRWEILLNWIVGFTLLGTAVVLFYKVVFKNIPSKIST